MGIKISCLFACLVGQHRVFRITRDIIFFDKRLTCAEVPLKEPPPLNTSLGYSALLSKKSRQGVVIIAIAIVPIQTTRPQFVRLTLRR